MKIGIPRALLYYRYDVLWETFFQELGMEVVLSPVTDKDILDDGNLYAIDENCLSAKLFFGHTAKLEGLCDAVFVPRIANYGKDGIMCSRFEALYDIAVNTFREKNIKFITCDVDLFQKHGERNAYVSLGMELGQTRSISEKAYETASLAAQKAQQAKIDAQQKLL